MNKLKKERIWRLMRFDVNREHFLVSHFSLFCAKNVNSLESTDLQEAFFIIVDKLHLFTAFFPSVSLH